MEDIRRTLPPWLKVIPQQLDLFRGIFCPICERKALLVSMVFKEGTGFICEKCYEHKILADVYKPPSFKKFMRRVLRGL